MRNDFKSSCRCSSLISYKMSLEERFGMLGLIVSVQSKLFRRVSHSAAYRFTCRKIATPGHKGFYVSWQSASQQCAVVFAALLGVVLNSTLSTQQMTDWGWRVPL